MASYFEEREAVVATLDGVEQRVAQVEALAAQSGLRFYWRGQADADWGIHSSLHRAICAQRGLAVDDIDQVTEREVVVAEEGLVTEARDWIRPAVGARLTTIDLMARLQHEGIPTRLLDFTDNAKVALYFAVADEPARDGRLVVAAARRGIAEHLRNAFDVPWKYRHRDRPEEWSEQMYALEDHQDFLRIIRQAGVFITGGTPSTRPMRLLHGSRMGAAEVRKIMSLPLALHLWAQAEGALTGAAVRGRTPTVASALTLRVPAASKQAIRDQLEVVGITWASLFPDPGGLASRGAIASGLFGAL